MPVRNGVRWLGEAMHSVIGQTFEDWELVVIDDGSTDDTPRILDQFAKLDRRIRIIRQGPLGLIAALNHAFAEVRAPLLARLDADDCALPQRLDRQVDYLNMHPEIGLVGSWAQKIDEDGRQRRQLRPPTEHEALTRVLMHGNPFVASSVMLRTDLVRRLAGSRAGFLAAEDYDLWLRVAEITKVANLPEGLVEYRWHSENVTSRNAIRQAFSARLARRSARARRQTGHDPAEHLVSPPNWRSAEADTSFYAEDAALYRLLDLADATSPVDAYNDADFSILATRFADLTHAECVLAAQAMLNCMRRAERARAREVRRLFFRLLWRRPGMLPRTAWSSLPAVLVR